MKIYLLIAAGFLGLSACQSMDAKNTGKTDKITADTANYTSIQWIDSVKDIGTVTAGNKAEIQFAFVNSGSKPLFIIAAKPGCGCTVADYPKEAIAPGAKGSITAEYKIPAQGAEDFRKSIAVTANTKGTTDHNIFFFGKIKKEGDSAKAAAK